MSPSSHRPMGTVDPAESRFSVDYAAPGETTLLGRERELGLKLRALLESPYGDAIARILDETFRLIPQTARV